MKRYLFFIIFLSASLSALADNYKILYLSTKTISIGGHDKKVGDTFSDQSVIIWDSSLATQSMRIKRVGGKGVKTKIVTKELMKDLKKKTVAELDKQKNSTYNFKDQNIKNNHTSTRQAVRY